MAKEAPTVYTVAKKVMAMPELALMVLSNLAMEDLLNWARVSRDWKQVILQSNKLMQRLYLAPKPISRSAFVTVAEAHTLRLCPCYEDRKGEPPCPIIREQRTKVAVCAINPLFLPVEWDGNTDFCEWNDERYFHEDLMPAARLMVLSGSRDFQGEKEISRGEWGGNFDAMYITQPPLEKLRGYVSLSSEFYVDDNTFQLNAPSGIKFRHLRALLWSRYDSAPEEMKQSVVEDGDVVMSKMNVNLSLIGYNSAFHEVRFAGRDTAEDVEDAILTYGI